LETLQARPDEAKDLLKARLGKIAMEAKGEGPSRFCEATGAFNISFPLEQPARLDIQVAGAGFEPATFGL
jgi:hypothetical protein